MCVGIEPTTPTRDTLWCQQHQFRSFGGGKWDLRPLLLQVGGVSEVAEGRGQKFDEGGAGGITPTSSTKVHIFTALMIDQLLCGNPLRDAP